MDGHLWELAIPLRRPFASAAATIRERRVVIVRVTDGSIAGWGEAAPYPGVTPDSVDDAVRTLVRGSVLSPTAAAAIDEATADLVSRRAGLSLAQSIGASGSRFVPTSVAVGLDEDPVERLEATGAAAVKLKVRPGEDIGRFSALREAHPDLTIGVDGNGSYEWSERESLLELDRLGVDYIEQPFPSDDLESHTRFRDEVVAPVALDEPIDSVNAAIRVIEAGACDVIVVKPARIGITAARTVHDLALASGHRIKASGLVETGIGRAFTRAVAALPGAAYSDVAEASWFLAGGVGRSGSDGVGIGFDPDPDAFGRYVVRESPLGSRIWD